MAIQRADNERMHSASSCRAVLASATGPLCPRSWWTIPQLMLWSSDLTLACLLTLPKPGGSICTPCSLDHLGFPVTSVTSSLGGISSALKSSSGLSFPGQTSERLISERFSNLPKATQPVRGSGMP